MQLSQLTKLSHSVEIVVPSTVNIDQNLDQNAIDSIVDNVASKLSIKFGGATVSTAFGTWYSDVLQSLVKENVTVVKSFAMEMTNEDIEQVLIIAQEVKEVMSQEAVMLTIDNVAYLL